MTFETTNDGSDMLILACIHYSTASIINIPGREASSFHELVEVEIINKFYFMWYQHKATVTYSFSIQKLPLKYQINLIQMG